jgi:hypothetical protein
MAQTGYTPILIYSSSTAAAAPAAGSLTNSTLGSELAINITDGKLFYKDNANAVQVIGWKVVPATAGGTGQTSYVQGDLLYATSSTTLGRLADVATGNALISGGVGADPSWGKIGLTTHVSGVLPVANGGTNASSASITAFNNITGYTASGATGTTSTNLVFSTSPTLTTPTINTAASVGGTWTAAATWTLPAFTLGGTVSGGGNQINNVVIGTTTPLAGSFTTVTTTGDLTAAVQVKSTNSTSTTQKYVIERVFDLYKTGSGSPTTLTICDITSGYASGGMFLEVAVTGQFSDFDGLSGSYLSAMVSANNATSTQIDRVDGNQVGVIGLSSVSSGVVRVALSSMRTSGFNGVAYVRVVCGNASNASNVEPSGVTIA